MGFQIEDRLVIGVASSALFDLAESQCVCETQGVEQYRLRQEQNLDAPFPRGGAFPFVRRFLSIDQAFPDEKPVEVALRSRNSPETGLLVFRSIQHYGLDLTRAAFHVSLFLSASQREARRAIDENYSGRCDAAFACV